VRQRKFCAEQVRLSASIDYSILNLTWAGWLSIVLQFHRHSLCGINYGHVNNTQLLSMNRGNWFPPNERRIFTCLYDAAARRTPDFYLRESLRDPRFYTRDYFGPALFRQHFCAWVLVILSPWLHPWELVRKVLKSRDNIVSWQSASFLEVSLLLYLYCPFNNIPN